MALGGTRGFVGYFCQSCCAKILLIDTAAEFFSMIFVSLNPSVFRITYSKAVSLSLLGDLATSSSAS